MKLLDRDLQKNTPNLPFLVQIAQITQIEFFYFLGFSNKIIAFFFHPTKQGQQTLNLPTLKFLHYTKLNFLILC
jgi:hypothetical protein